MGTLVKVGIETDLIDRTARKPPSDDRCLRIPTKVTVALQRSIYRSCEIRLLFPPRALDLGSAASFYARCESCAQSNRQARRKRIAASKR
jgi:hypothetical protein